MKYNLKHQKVKFDPQIWNDIILKVSSKSTDIVSEISRVKSQLKRDEIINNVLLFGSEFDKYIVNEECSGDLSGACLKAVGVDSSITPPIRLGPYFLAATSAARSFNISE